MPAPPHGTSRAAPRRGPREALPPEAYEAWYHTARGRWIAAREFALCASMLEPWPGASLLDVGTGTGHFARLFAGQGLRVTGLDPDRRAIAFAGAQGGNIRYLAADARRLPFADQRFDYAAAITSLCFVPDPAQALAEMWRVAERGVLLGLLHRHSLLYRQKRGQGAYAGARWDDLEAVRTWTAALAPAPRLTHGYAVGWPAGGLAARLAEPLLARLLPWGAFLAVVLWKQPRR
ncbi:MAG: methyltransferase domain-containing protein [Betaproteobacteria bacterium]|nr:methyltransferase domain-containing protein [Betaproteobacteria bacterium]